MHMLTQLNNNFIFLIIEKFELICAAVYSEIALKAFLCMGRKD